MTNPTWDKIECQGFGPQCLSHHTSTVIKSNLYVIGGYISHEQQNQVFYKLDLNQRMWEQI